MSYSIVVAPADHRQAVAGRQTAKKKRPDTLGGVGPLSPYPVAFGGYPRSYAILTTGLMEGFIMERVGTLSDMVIASIV